jgi:hypothetical protein
MLRQIQKDQLGIRQHSYIQNDKLRDLQQRLSPHYDSTSAFLENVGFKHGMTFPFRPWLSSLKSNHLELPVVFRDTYLKLTKFRTVALDDAKQMLKKSFQMSRRSRGLFCLDFTVSNFTDIPYCSKLYTYVLALFKAEKAWVCTCSEIADWWEKRSKITIEEGEFELSVYFPDALNHATIQLYGDMKVAQISGAEARIDGNHIHFTNLEANTIAIIELEKKVV